MCKKNRKTKSHNKNDQVRLLKTEHEKKRQYTSLKGVTVVFFNNKRAKCSKVKAYLFSEGSIFCGTRTGPPSGIGYQL